MCGENNVVSARHIFEHIGDQVPVLAHRRITDRIRDIDGRRSRPDGGGADFIQKITLGSSGVLAKRPGERNAPDRRVQHLVARHAKLCGPVKRAGGDKHMDAWLPCLLQRVSRGADIRLHAARKRANARLNRTGNRAHSLKIAGARAR